MPFFSYKVVVRHLLSNQYILVNTLAWDKSCLIRGYIVNTLYTLSMLLPYILSSTLFPLSILLSWHPSIYWLNLPQDKHRMWSPSYSYLYIMPLMGNIFKSGFVKSTSTIFSHIFLFPLAKCYCPFSLFYLSCYQ